MAPVTVDTIKALIKGDTKSVEERIDKVEAFAEDQPSRTLDNALDMATGAAKDQVEQLSRR